MKNLIFCAVFLINLEEWNVDVFKDILKAAVMKSLSWGYYSCALNKRFSSLVNFLIFSILRFN